MKKKFNTITHLFFPEIIARYNKIEAKEIRLTVEKDSEIAGLMADLTMVRGKRLVQDTWPTIDR